MRYKYVVQVVVGEQRGEAVRSEQHTSFACSGIEPFKERDFTCRMGCRCFWDPKTDDYAQQVFSNVSLVQASHASRHALADKRALVAGEPVLCGLSIWSLPLLMGLQLKLPEVDIASGSECDLLLAHHHQVLLLSQVCF